MVLIKSYCVLLHTFQYLASRNNAIIVIGGAYLNELGSSEDGTIQSMMKKCLSGEFGEAAAEVKVAVLLFHFTPSGIPPYFILVAQTQSINRSNSFASHVMSLCAQAAASNGNAG